MHSDMRASDSSTVAAPTVDPGLGETRNMIHSRVEHQRTNLLEVIELKAELFASLQIVEEALIRLFALLATSFEIEAHHNNQSGERTYLSGFPRLTR